MALSFAGGTPLYLSSRPVGLEDHRSGDLFTRMFVRYDNGDIVMIRPLGQGYQEIEEVFASGEPPLKYRAHRGLYVVSECEPGPDGRPMPGSGLRIQFPVDPAQMPEPLPGAAWSGEIVKIFDDDSRVTSTMDIAFSAAPSIELSGVRYGVVHAEITFDAGTERQLKVCYKYLPALRTSLYVSSKFENDEETRIAPVKLLREA